MSILLVTIVDAMIPFCEVDDGVNILARDRMHERRRLSPLKWARAKAAAYSTALYLPTARPGL